MAYERTIWKNREVEYPRRYIITDNGDGTVTIEPSPGNIIEPGTPIIAANMNNIEEGIVLSLSQIGDINDTLNGQKIALGQNSIADGSYSIALGNMAKGTADETIAIGDAAFALAKYAIVMGTGATGNNQGVVALGAGANANENSFASVLVGQNTRSTNSHTVSIGYGAYAYGQESAAIGALATSDNNKEGILGTGPGSSGPNAWFVRGSFTVNGTKNFEIPHPKPEKKATHRIRHGAVESPTPGDTLYRYKIQTTKDNDIVTIDLPDYFVWLNKDVQIWVTGQGHFGNGYGVLNRETEQLEVHCQFAGEYNVLVIGTRNDDHQSVQDWNIKGVEREIGESWTGETYTFEVNEIMEVEEIKEEVM